MSSSPCSMTIEQRIVSWDKNLNAQISAYKKAFASGETQAQTDYRLKPSKCTILDLALRSNKRYTSQILGKKGIKWANASKMPEYSIFEIVMLATPDFDNLKTLSESVHSSFVSLLQEIFNTLEAQG